MKTKHLRSCGNLVEVCVNTLVLLYCHLGTWSHEHNSTDPSSEDILIVGKAICLSRAQFERIDRQQITISHQLRARLCGAVHIAAQPPDRNGTKPSEAWETKGGGLLGV